MAAAGILLGIGSFALSPAGTGLLQSPSAPPVAGSSLHGGLVVEVTTPVGTVVTGVMSRLDDDRWD